MATPRRDPKTTINVAPNLYAMLLVLELASNQVQITSAAHSAKTYIIRIVIVRLFDKKDIKSATIYLVKKQWD